MIYSLLLIDKEKVYYFYILYDSLSFYLRRDRNFVQ
jgi:hypothetical protein